MSIKTIPTTKSNQPKGYTLVSPHEFLGQAKRNPGHAHALTADPPSRASRPDPGCRQRGLGPGRLVWFSGDAVRLRRLLKGRGGPSSGRWRPQGTGSREG